MTCIVGLVNNGVVYLGGDSLGVAGLDAHSRVDEKVFKNGEMIFGVMGSYRMGQILRYSLSIPEQSKNKDDFAFMCTDFVDAVMKSFKDKGYARTKDTQSESGGSFLVGYKGQLFSFESDYQVGRYEADYHAIGCGGDYAKGALAILINKNLEPKEIITKALEVAVTFSCGVRPPFNIVELKND